MKKQRFTEEQIIGFLKQAEAGAASRSFGSAWARSAHLRLNHERCCEPVSESLDKRALEVRAEHAEIFQNRT